MNIDEFFGALAEVGLHVDGDYPAPATIIRHDRWSGKYSVSASGHCRLDPLKLAAVITLLGLEGASLEVQAETVWESGLNGDTSRVCPEVTLWWTNDIKLDDAPSALK